MTRQDMEHKYEVAHEVATAVELLAGSKDSLSPSELGREISIIVSQVQAHQLELKHVLAAMKSETLEDFLEALDTVEEAPDNVICPICLAASGNLMRHESSPELRGMHIVPKKQVANG